LLVEKITSALANMTSFYMSPLKHTADALDRTNAYANEYKLSLPAEQQAAFQTSYDIFASRAQQACARILKRAARAALIKSGIVEADLARLRLRDRFTFAQLQPTKKSAPADAPKVYLYKGLVGADSARDLFDMLKLLTRDGDDSPSRKSALFEEYNKLRDYVQSILDSTFDNAKTILHEPYRFITDAKDRLGLTICADVALRAVTAISSSISAEGGMSHVTNMGAANRMSMLDRSFLNEVFLRGNRTMVGAVLIPLALERIRRTAAIAQVPLFA
jgi:hypothetical protein